MDRILAHGWPFFFGLSPIILGIVGRRPRRHVTLHRLWPSGSGPTKAYTDIAWTKAPSELMMNLFPTTDVCPLSSLFRGSLTGNLYISPLSFTGIHGQCQCYLIPIIQKPDCQFSASASTIIPQCNPVHRVNSFARKVLPLRGCLRKLDHKAINSCFQEGIQAQACGVRMPR